MIKGLERSVGGPIRRVAEGLTAIRARRRETKRVDTATDSLARDLLEGFREADETIKVRVAVLAKEQGLVYGDVWNRAVYLSNPDGLPLLDLVIPRRISGNKKSSDL